MAHPEDKKAALRFAYVRSRLPMPEAAAAVGVSVVSARKWRTEAKAAGDDWDMARQAARMAQGGLGDLTTEVLEDFIMQFKRAMEELRTNAEIPSLERAEMLARLSDSYIKTTKAAANANPELARLSVALDLLGQLGDFVQAKFPEHAQAFVTILEPFGAQLSKRYG